MKSNPNFPAQALLALCLLFSCTRLSAQHSVQLTPLQPLSGKFSLGYEQAFGPKTTFMVEYQRWFEHRQNGIGSLLFFPLAGSTTNSTVSGGRLSAFMRFYRKEALQGGFMEVGAYTGKHDIEVVEETSVLVPDGSFFFLPTYQTSVKEAHYKNVRAYGLRLGGGFHRVSKHVSVECSGGLSLNGNSEGLRPSFGFNPVSLYSRFAVGFGF